jgi:predicted nucleotidyltransferase
MLTEAERATVVRVARKYHLTEVILFGSSVEREDANEIGIGIRGIRPETFFDFYGELLLSLPKPVDLVNLEKRNRFTALVESEGIRLHGQFETEGRC